MEEDHDGKRFVVIKLFVYFYCYNYVLDGVLQSAAASSSGNAVAQSFTAPLMHSSLEPSSSKARCFAVDPVIEQRAELFNQSSVQASTTTVR